MGNKQSSSTTTSVAASTSPFIESFDITYGYIIPLLKLAECISFGAVCKAHFAMVAEWLRVYGPKCVTCNEFWKGGEKKLTKHLKSNKYKTLLHPLYVSFYYDCTTTKITRVARNSASVPPENFVIHSEFIHSSCISKKYTWEKGHHCSAPLLLESKKLVSWNIPTISECGNCGSALKYSLDKDVPYVISPVFPDSKNELTPITATVPYEVKRFMTQEDEYVGSVGFVLCEKCTRTGCACEYKPDTLWIDPLITPMQIGGNRRVICRFASGHEPLAKALAPVYDDLQTKWADRTKKVVLAHPKRFCILREVEISERSIIESLRTIQNPYKIC